MISVTSNSSHPRRAQAGAAHPSLLMDLPRDVVPSICVRLAGPDLLQLARVCRQAPIDKQAMLKEWTSRELHELGGLDQEELWTRFLDLAANVADLIDSADWETFLHRVESKQEGYAVLMQLAVLAPAAGKVNEGPLSEVHLLAPVLGPAECTVLENLLIDADEKPWMARAAVAVITGLCRHVAVEGKDSDLDQLAALFAGLPLAYQVKILPYLGSTRSACTDIPATMNAAVNAAHTECLRLHFLGSGPYIDREAFGKQYVARLHGILNDPALIPRLSPVRTSIQTHLALLLEQAELIDP
jgi:hypothetical protein